MASPQPTNTGSTQRDKPPVNTTLSLSSSTCSLGGNPPFTVTIKHENTSDHPIWALVSLFTEFCHHVELLDPARRHRKMGPVSTWNSDEWDEDARSAEDSRLVRLDTGQAFELSYTFTTFAGMRADDMRTMTAGQAYEITLGVQKWWWMFEGDGMPAGAGMNEAKREKVFVGRSKAAEWTPECVALFEAEP